MSVENTDFSPPATAVMFLLAIHPTASETGDFWHGGVPYNCAVSIIEVQNGVSTLLADNKIYYDPSDCVNFYKEVK